MRDSHNDSLGQGRTMSEMVTSVQPLELLDPEHDAGADAISRAPEVSALHMVPGATVDYSLVFQGLQAYGETGMTRLEEMVDAAFHASDQAIAAGARVPTGAALFTSGESDDGKVMLYAGCTVESSSDPALSVCAERTTLLKAVSEGRVDVMAMAIANASSDEFPVPDGNSRQFLSEYGDFPVFLVNRHLRLKRVTTYQLYPHRTKLAASAARREAAPKRKGEPSDEGIVQASRDARGKKSPMDWDVGEVCRWLEEEAEMAEYSDHFSRAKVNGAMLMNLADEDLELTCKVPHPLHRRKIIMAIDKIKDDELDMRWGGGPNDLDEFIATLDGDRIRLIARLKVVFDRADSDHDGSISVFEMRVAFEELGRDIATERVAAFLVDRESENAIFSFPDFASAYTELFSVDDPEVRINTEAQTHFNRQIKLMRESKHGKVSHVKLNRRKDKHDPYGEAGPPRTNLTDGPHHYDREDYDPDDELARREKRDRVRDLVARDRELVVGAHVEVDLGGTRFRNGVITRCHVSGEFDVRYDDGTTDTYLASDKVNPAGHAARMQADVADEVARRRGGKSAVVEEALVSVTRLAEVKEVFDRFAVDNLLTGEDVIQALTELGTTSPRSQISRYLRARNLSGMQRKINFFEFLRAIAATSFESSGIPPQLPHKKWASRERDSRAIDPDSDYMTRPWRDAGLENGRYAPYGEDAPRLRSGINRYRSRDEDGYGGRRKERFDDGDSDDGYGWDRERSRRRDRYRERGRSFDSDDSRNGRGRSRDRDRDRDRDRHEREREREDRRERERARERRQREDREYEREEARRRARDREYERERERERERDRDGYSRLETSARRNEFREGDTVEAQYRGKSRYYPGKINRDNRDGTYDIDYDDGEKERDVKADLIRLKERDSDRDRDRDRERERDRGRDRDRDSGGRLREGMKVEARYRGKARYYAGKIRADRGDGTYDIDYDDGERETRVKAEYIKAHGASTFEEGQKIEAQYRGKTRYYPGRIRNDNRDGTYDIDYDDGEKETDVQEKYIKAREGLEGDGRRSSFREGEKVEARYRGKARYYPGRINRDNRDGTYDIDYDDGEKERGVQGELIKSMEGGGGGGGGFREGEKVEARYRGKARYYRGRINRDNRDGTYDIDYDDGEKERGVQGELIKSMEGGGGGGGGGGEKEQGVSAELITSKEITPALTPEAQKELLLGMGLLETWRVDVPLSDFEGVHVVGEEVGDSSGGRVVTGMKLAGKRGVEFKLDYFKPLVSLKELNLENCHGATGNIKDLPQIGVESNPIRIQSGFGSDSDRQNRVDSNPF